MKLKAILLGMVAACCLPVTAQAETVPTDKNYQVSCISTSEQEQQNFNCNSFSVSYDQSALEKLQQSSNSDAEVAQRTRRTRSRRKENKFYLGTNMGLFIPFDSEPDVGFAPPNIFGGYKFNKYVGADLEFFYFFGGTEVDDLGYFSFGFLANARFTYPFSQKTNSIYAFVSPGLGYGRANPTGDVADRLNLDGSGGFTFQIKTGIGYPISDLIDIFGQLRYLNVGTEGENLDGLTIDAGATFKF